MIRIRATDRLRAELQSRSRGRPLVIDYFASARCGAVVGDIDARFATPQTETHVMVTEVDGVSVFVERRLVPLLEEAAIELDLQRLPLFTELRVTMDRPEFWLDFLGRPGIVRRLRTGPGPTL